MKAHRMLLKDQKSEGLGTRVYDIHVPHYSDSAAELWKVSRFSFSLRWIALHRRPSTYLFSCTVSSGVYGAFFSKRNFCSRNRLSKKVFLCLPNRVLFQIYFFLTFIDVAGSRWNMSSFTLKEIYHLQLQLCTIPPAGSAPLSVLFLPGTLLISLCFHCFWILRIFCYQDLWQSDVSSEHSSLTTSR